MKQFLDLFTENFSRGFFLPGGRTFMRNDFEQPTIQPFSDAKDNKK